MIVFGVSTFVLAPRLREPKHTYPKHAREMLENFDEGPKGKRSERIEHAERAEPEPSPNQFALHFWLVLLLSSSTVDIMLLHDYDYLDHSRT